MKTQSALAALVALFALSFPACKPADGISFKRDAPPGPAAAGLADKLTADQRFSPPWWQTTIGLPDDWQKTLVSKEGALLYDYPGDFSGFGTRISVELEGAGKTTSSQSMDNPRIPIVRTVLSDAAGKGLLSWDALAVVPGDNQTLPISKRGGAGTSPAGMPPRGDVLLVRKAAKGLSISLVVQSKKPIEIVDLTVFRGRQRFLTLSARWDGIAQEKGGLRIVFPARVEELAVYCASGHEAAEVRLDWARAQPARAEKYWASRDFPYGVIRLPDPALQGPLDASIRNIYQAREIKDGLPIFQVGPTCYRGLWVVDGAFILEAMTYLGRGLEARAGIEHLLTRQKPDGSFDVLGNYWKENGIVLYILTRHALLTGDRDWLKKNWEVVRRVVAAIQELRKRSRKDPAAPEAGLMPPGVPDGGIGGVVAEYTNVYWNLAGLKAAVEAARLLKAPEETAWEAEFNDFWAVFQAAVKRDAKADGSGGLVLPILMKPQEGIDPVRGQWAFCHAVFPGRLFGPDDPLARGNMRLLEAHEKEGIILGTGWMADGLWNYFASFYAHAELWLGNGPKAAEIYYAFANHASPLRAWREEQAPRDAVKTDKFVGDMPHNWASAEFIRLTRNLLVLERGAELHVLEGIPRTWLAPGGVTELKDVATNFGPISLKLEVAADGKNAKLAVTPPPGPDPPRIVVHLGAWAAESKAKPVKIDKRWEIEIPLTGVKNPFPES
jgi:hypothetical protein